MSFQLPPLPFSPREVSSWLSTETLDFHHDRHHRLYVDKLNQLVKGTGFENSSLDEIVMDSKGALFNNAAQAWNHSFYWFGMGALSRERNPLKNLPILQERVNESFGSLGEMLVGFSAAATGHFGSGWVWLVSDMKTKRLEIISTGNAENPMRMGKHALLVCDVWEHAYYIDYRNARSKYVDGFLDSINWEFVNKNLKIESESSTSKVMAGAVKERNL